MARKPRPHPSSHPPRAPRPHGDPTRAESGTREERYLARGVRIVFEDDDLLVLDKPTGLVTADPTVAGAAGSMHASEGRTGRTLFDLVKRYVRESGGRAGGPARERSERRSGPRAFVVHRLDKEASGLVVFAKTERALSWLKEDLKAKRVHRRYVALAEGAVGPVGHEGTISLPIENDGPRPRRGHAAREEADEPSEKQAVTHYRVIAAGHGYSLLEVRLETGRKNQIRVHLSRTGHPLAGDRRFGAKSDPIGRLGLHAQELGFTHPASGRSLHFVSPAAQPFYRAVGTRREQLEPLSPPPKGPETAPKSAAGAPKAGPAIAHTDTSWESVSGWYDSLLEGEGGGGRLGEGRTGNDHYARTILPGTLRLLQPRPEMRVLDVACGQGILCRQLASIGVRVVGVDASAGLIDAARKRTATMPGGPEAHARLRFEVGDATRLESLATAWGLEPQTLDAVTCVMALSNIEPLEPVMRGVSNLLKPGGLFVWVVTHPAFRAIGQTHWGWDEQKQQQYRRVDGYLSTARHEVRMHPGKASRGQTGGEATTWTFHRPLQAYVAAMSRAGLLVEALEEWPSMRASDSGPRAKEENRARREIPLFLGVRAVKRPA